MGMGLYKYIYIYTYSLSLSIYIYTQDLVCVYIYIYRDMQRHFLDCEPSSLFAHRQEMSQSLGCDSGSLALPEWLASPEKRSPGIRQGCIKM